MRVIYHLSTCSTCKKIIKEINPGISVVLVDIKSESIPPHVLDSCKEKTGSYESLFSKKAVKYRSLGLNQKVITEPMYRALILEEYTFLKRPICIYDEIVTVGNSALEIEKAKEAFKSLT